MILLKCKNCSSVIIQDHQDSASNSEFKDLQEELSNIIYKTGHETTDNNSDLLLSLYQSETMSSVEIVSDSSKGLLFDSQEKLEQFHISSHHDSSNNMECYIRIRNVDDLIDKQKWIDGFMCQDCACHLFQKLETKTHDLYFQTAVYSTTINEDIPNLEFEECEHLVNECLKLDVELNLYLDQIKILDLELLNLRNESSDYHLKLKEIQTDQEKTSLYKSQFEAKNDQILSNMAFADTLNATLIDDIEAIKKINIYNDLFHISHEGSFATINEFRLGRLPEIRVEWSEINAALGQALLLLYLMSKKTNFYFENYKLVPMGNCSRIYKTTGDKANYEFYFPEDFNPLRMIAGKSIIKQFDYAMLAFVDCVHQFSLKLLSMNSDFILPLKIEKDKIGRVSIFYISENNQINWTIGMKNLLICLKWCLAYLLNIE